MLRFVEKTRNSHRQNAPSEDRSVGRALREIEARRPPLPGARWPSRRLPEAEWATHSLWRPGNVVGPQRPIIMWHSPPANRPTRRRVRRPGIGSAWHALDATTCYVFAPLFGPFYPHFAIQSAFQQRADKEPKKHRRHWEDRPWWRDPPDRMSLQ